MNENQIDEIHIHNKGGDMKGFCRYAVQKPEGLKRQEIVHYRPNGYKELLRSALALIINRDAKILIRKAKRKSRKKKNAGVAKKA